MQSDRGLVCLNPDGSVRWRYEAELPVIGIPAVGDDGTIYCGIYNGFLGAWQPDGELKWMFETDGLVSAAPALGRDGTIYVSSGDWNLYALNPEGEEIWSTEVFTTGAVPPSIGADGTIYVVGNSDLIAVSPDGAIRWRVTVNGQTTTAPAIGADGTIYFGAYGKELHAVSPQGEKLWSFPVAESFGNSSPILGSDGTIYAAAGNTMYAIHPNGTKRWAFESPSPIGSTPSLAADGTLYFNSYERIFFALDSSGKVKWSLETEYRVNDSPVLNAEGVLCIPLYLSVQAIAAGTPLDPGPWPTLQQDPQRQGRSLLLPTVALLSPAAPINVELGQAVALSAEAVSPNGEINRIEYWNETKMIGVVEDPPFDFIWTNASHGIHYVFARAHDELGAMDSSEPVRIDVVPPDTSPFFISHPATQVSSNGATIELTSDAFGSAPLAFQWFKDGVPIEHGTNASLSILNASLADSAYYSVTASNQAGTAESLPAVVSVVQPFVVKWIAEGVDPEASPAIAEGTRIIAGTGNGIQAIGPTGQFLWSYYAGAWNDVNSPPTIGPEGSIYFSSQDGALSSLSPQGELLWSNPTNGWGQGAAAVASDGTIYAAGGTNLNAYSSSGDLKWRVGLPNRVPASPSIGHDGTVYLGTLATYIPARTNFSAWFFAFNPDGSTNWSVELTNNIFSSAAIADDGTVIFGAADHRVYAFSPDGVKKWEFLSDGPISGSAAIGEDGTIYIGGAGPKHGAVVPGRLYALTPDGSLKWKYPLYKHPSGTPALARDGSIYVGTSSGGLFAFNSNGTLKWDLQTGWEIRSSPVVGFDGTVYFVNGDHKLYAIEGGSPPQRSAWPMFQRDVKHTGNAGSSFESDTFFYPFSSNAFDNEVNRILADGDKLYVGGAFQIAGGVPANHIAVWAGSRWSGLGTGTDAPVWAIASDESNIYVGGAFQTAGDTNASHVARWDGERWHSLGEGFPEYIYDLELRDGMLFAAGGFSAQPDKTGSCVNIWDGESWSPLGTNLNGVVFDLFFEGTNIFLAGYENLWKINDPVSSVAHWTGEKWAGVGHIYGYAATLARYQDDLYVGGERLYAGANAETPLGGLARWNGSQWTPVGGLTNAHVSALVASGDYLFAGGTFTNISGVAASRIARFDGTNWITFGEGVSGYLPGVGINVNSILPRGEELFIGGAFTRAGENRDTFHFAHWNGFEWQSYGPLLHFIDGQFQLTLSDALGRSYGIEASTDLVHWERIATYSNLTNALQFVDENSSNLQQRFYRAVTP